MIDGVNLQAMSILSSAFNSPAKALLSVGSGILAFMGPISAPIAIAAALIAIDAIYGYKVSKKYGQKLQSKRLWSTLMKCKESFLLIVFAAVIEAFVVPSIYLHLVEFVAGIICFTEFWSWLESLCELYPEWPICRILKKWIKRKGEKYLEMNLDEELKTKISDDITKEDS